MAILNRNIFKEFTGDLTEVNINCKTEREAMDLLNFLGENGFKWAVTGNDFETLNNTYWNTYKGKTFYNVNRLNKRVSWGLMDDFEKTYYEWRPDKAITRKNLTWDIFVSESVAIHCKTQSEIEEFLAWVLKVRDQKTGKLISSCYFGWRDYNDKVCFEYIKERQNIEYSSKGFYQSEGFTIVEWINPKNMLEISGTINTDLSLRDFYEKFIDFIESQDSSFGGSINDVTKEV
jgi:hypothetical protein